MPRKPSDATSMQFEPSANQRNEMFMRLFIEHERQIHAYIATLLPNRHDAEDVLQETSVVAWQKFDRFQPGTNFIHWTCAIARLEVLKFRRQQKTGRVVFNDALLEQLSIQQLQQSNFWEDWHQKLLDCLAKLRATDRDVFLRCSRSGTTIKRVAEQLGCPANTIYKTFSRVRRALIECIHRAVSQEERK